MFFDAGRNLPATQIHLVSTLMADLPIPVIYNPVANQGKASSIAQLLQSQDPSDARLRWQATQAPEDIGRMTAAAAAEGCEKIIILGGDGTVHAAVDALMRLPAEKRPVLGIIPAGSGNDFAFSSGLSTDPLQAMQDALLGSARPIDVGEIQTDTGIDRFWVNTTGIGFDSIVVYRAQSVHIVRGFLIYLIAAIQTLVLNNAPMPMHIQRDGAVSDEDLHFIVFCNGKREGGGFLMSPLAELDDGLLDYLAIRQMFPLKMLYGLPMVLVGKSARLKESLIGRFRRMEVHSPTGMVIHVDGDMISDLNSPIHAVTVQIIPQAFRLASRAG